MESNVVQKMREALLAIKDVAERDMRHHVSMSESDSTSIRAWSNLFVSLSSKALSEPLRNCDVGTAEEQYLRMNKYCDKQNGREPCEKCQFLTRGLNCALAWAQMPYEEGDGDGRIES